MRLRTALTGAAGLAVVAVLSGVAPAMAAVPAPGRRRPGAAGGWPPWSRRARAGPS